MRRPPARQDRGVTGSRLGDRVVLIRVPEHGAFSHEQPKAALQLGAVAVQVIWPQLVDGDDDHQTGPRVRGGQEPHPRQERNERANHVTQNTRGWGYAVALTGRSWRTFHATAAATATTPAAR